MGYLEFVMSAFHDLKLKALDGRALPLAPFKGQVVLVVNVSPTAHREAETAKAHRG